MDYPWNILKYIYIYTYGILIMMVFNGHATGSDCLEAPTIYKAYLLGLWFRDVQGISTGNMALYATVPPF